MGVDLMDDLEKCVSRRLTNNSSTNVTGKNLNQACACVYGDVVSGGIFERRRIKTQYFYKWGLFKTLHSVHMIHVH